MPDRRAAAEEQSYVERARELRDAALRQRERTKAALADALYDKKHAVAGERGHAKVLLARDRPQKHHEAQRLREMHDRTYRERFATQEEAKAFDNSSWFKLTSWFRGPPVVEAPPPRLKMDTSAALDA